MPTQLAHHAYGKSNIRLVKVIRHAEQHDLLDMSIDIALEGEFDETFLTGDNRNVLPTDTIKNTVYALAKQHNFSTIEEFGLLLTEHFVGQFEHIKQAKTILRERIWQRIPIQANGEVDGESVPHQHAFMGANGETHIATVDRSADALSIIGGITELPILKTKGSGFSDFLRGEFTTLEETDDRLFGTNLSAFWTYNGDSSTIGFVASRANIRRTLLENFAHHDNSLSVQQTLFVMGSAVLDLYAEVKDIHLTMPNEHRLLVDLAPFGLDNPNEIFLPIDEPSGMIEARLVR